ncbi:MAG: virulence protein RhuM/Fic/DOC family protein, partial [Candidatus Magasanikbacteria bacterium]|nr:virulence protein RhuM/Fic/DOC family protein [Candidatus Magasanikbacteria bacterium]
MEKKISNGEIVIYKSKDGRVNLEAEVKNETVWLTQEQIAGLFGTQRPAITKHLNNIFRSKELGENSVCSILERTAVDGKSYKVKFYNLDAILSVGYRVNSKRATQFRIWATEVLRGYILSGYTLNQKRLLEVKGKQLDEFEQTASIIKKTIETRRLTGRESEGILKVITDYANSWVLLQKYDQDLLVAPAKVFKDKYHLTFEDARSAIFELRGSKKRKKEASELFGNERADSFKSVMGILYQTFGGIDLYPSTESKAAHLLYFVIKDHPFTDGNKRIASFLFIIFLAR